VVSYAAMKRLHLLFGILLFVVFVLTGQYMDKFLNHLHGMADGPRMLYRSRHIYILLSALINIGLGTYFSYQTETWRRALQILGSFLVVLASAVVIVAFFYEPQLGTLQTPITGRVMYALAGGTLLHMFGNLGYAGKVVQ
jgi:magnesium-transporting ATPase (P-type)